MNGRSWRDVCVGRERLIEDLFDTYRAAASGQPAFLVLLGQTGIGKTRAVQELYRRMTRECDPPSAGFPHGYWPDAFGTDETAYDVNPRTDQRELPPIPWLWFGIKFQPPEDLAGAGTTRPGPVLRDGDALNSALPILLTHLEEYERRRKVKGLNVGLATRWLMQILNLSTFGTLNTAVGVGKELRDTIKVFRELAPHHERAGSPLAEVEQRKRNERVDATLAALRGFLDPKQTDVPTVPVVLFLDDAQWIDRTTIDLVHRLWVEAHEKRWPLLVVATHWDDEWAAHRDMMPPVDGSPQRLAQFLDCLAPEPRDGIRALTVHPPDRAALKQWIRVALPGISEPHAEILLDKAHALAAPASDGTQAAGGSPRVLEQIFLTLESDPEEFFVGGKVDGPLRDEALAWIRDTVHDRGDLIRRRFEKLDRAVRKALGWSSVQGLRFLAEVTSEVGRRLADGFRIEGDARDHLETVERRGGWIQRSLAPSISAGRFNRCEFRQAAFHEVAHAQFAKGRAELDSVDQAVSATLSTWLQDGRLDPQVAPGDVPDAPADRLTPEELRDALMMTVARFRPDSSAGATLTEDRWADYGNALARLAYLDARTYFWDRAERTAIEFADARDSWPVSSVARYWQVGVGDILHSMRELERARRLFEPLARAWNEGPEPDEPVRLHEAGLLADRLGSVLLESGDRAMAHSWFEIALQRARGMLHLGESPEALRDVSVSLNKVGDVERAEGRRGAALVRYEESLAIARRVLERFGESPEALRDVSVSLERVGDVERAEGRRGAALVRYEESLAIRRRVLERFGESPGALRDVAVSQFRMATVRPDQAAERLTEAVALMQAIADRGWATSQNDVELRGLQAMLKEITEGTTNPNDVANP